MGEEELIPDYKRRVRAFSIISRVFIPVGIVCVVLGIALLAASVPFFVDALLKAEQSGDCVVTQTSIRCHGAVGAQIAWSTVGMVFGFFHTLLGLPLIIIGPIFRGKARQLRSIDESNGIDYGDSRYGK